MPTQTPGPECHVQVGTLIQRGAHELVDRWCRQVLKEQSQARRVHHETLRDHLPEFLREMGRRLGGTLSEAADSGGEQLASDHGEQRWEAGWSLAEVVWDYHVLRTVTLEYLEENLGRSLVVREAVAVGAALDEAIAASVGSFVTLQEAALREARDELERRVDVRTAELRRANEQLRAEIVKRERAQEHVRQQAELLDKTTDAIVVLGLDDIIRYWNLGAHRLYGWSADEALGNTSTALLFQEAFDRAAAQVAVEQHGEWSGELQQRTRDGRTLQVASRWTLLRDGHGRPEAVLVLNTDVTEARKLESHIRRAQRTESVGLLAGGIAHDLNNVLTPILMAVDLLQRALPDDERTVLLDGIRASAERGANLVRQVLLFARGSPAGRAPLDLHPIVEDVLTLLRPTTPKNIQIDAVVAADLWLVPGDATQLHQLLLNLCVNSNDAMPSGGVLSIRAENILLRAEDARGIPGTSAGPYVVLRVADTGAGIPADVLEHIWDPFFTTKPLGKGTGLGLSTAAGIIKGHGGAIVVTSQVGAGSRFEAYLPAMPDASRPIAPVSPTVAPTGHGELILVVDDEEILRDMARLLLETAGYRVLTAPDGPAALALFARHGREIRVLLTDLMMPKMDGRQLIRALRERGLQVPALLMSGLMSNAGEVQATGAHALLAKPFSRDDLLRALGEVLQ